MQIWSTEIKELESLYTSIKGKFPELEKELEQLIGTKDANVVMLYSRRCLEVIITDLCEVELKRPRKTEPLKGIIDKLLHEEKVPAYIITSMHGLNDLSTFGTHPKDYDPEQVKPVLNNLTTIIKWYLKYKNIEADKTVLKKQDNHHIISGNQDYSISNHISKPEKSIVVLPFENISSDLDQEYFSDGLTEEIITDLSQIHNLLVISRSSAMTFKGTKKKIPEIAQAVNVRYVLEGSVRKAGNNLRITAQLIDSMTDAHLWAEKYTGILDDVFDIQEKVSRSIVDALKLKLSTQEKKNITIEPTKNVQLHECYLKAKYEIYTWTKESLDRAVRILQSGLKNYGANALLFATLGEAKYLYYDIGAETSENILNEVEEYAKKALSLEPDIAQGYKLYSLLEMGRGSLTEGYRYMKNACNADPNDPSILMHTAGFIGMYLGHPLHAEPLYRKVLDIDPLSAMNYLFIGLDQYFQGNYENAIGLLQKSSQIDPEFIYSIFWLPVFLTANNQKHEALELIDQIIKENRMSEVFQELILFIKYVFKGRKIQALNTLSDETKKYTWNDPLFSGLMPGYFSLIHEKEKALNYLNHAVNRGFINYPFFFKIDPFLENIRKEFSFQKLMEKVKYEWENFEV
jgi:TolB-like protein/tetratricopeptide (TPR) repeat protein